MQNTSLNGVTEVPGKRKVYTFRLYMFFFTVFVVLSNSDDKPKHACMS